MCKGTGLFAKQVYFLNTSMHIYFCAFAEKTGQFAKKPEFWYKFVLERHRSS
jgi:hypothetical protein